MTVVNTEVLINIHKIGFNETLSLSKNRGIFTACGVTVVERSNYFSWRGRLEVKTCNMGSKTIIDDKQENTD